MLHSALKQAVQWRLLSRNVSDNVALPRRVKTDMHVWDGNQVALFLIVEQDDELAALWRLAFLTGMRRGEILGLWWEDLDLTTGTLLVKRSLGRGAGGVLEYGPTKTHRGRRPIALSASVVAALQRHRVRQAERKMALGADYKDPRLVFANEAGEPIHPNTLTRRFQALTKKAGLPRLRLHDIRHTAATLLLENNVNVKIVSEMLGHSAIAMTLDRYSHVSPEMQRAAADSLDRLIEGAP